MRDPEGRTPGPDDTAAFERFYAGSPDGQPEQRGILYRIFVGWWRDKG
ncbi:MAG: hypothetical protein ACRDYY_13410 [Acidimicrobiales bacterium]